MPDLTTSIAQVRDSVCAIMRISPVHKKQKKGHPQPIQYTLAFVGTAWCVVPDRFLVTAHHIFREGGPRDQKDVFYAFTVPGNGNPAFHFPVTNVVLEDQSLDLAILELGPPADATRHIQAVPVSFSHPSDGSTVLTYGFPAPEIKGAQLDQSGRFLGGGVFFLKGHANEGIVSAQYDLNGGWFFEFNVGWHHGESGGPVFQLQPLSAIAIMQHYRNIQSPHGIFQGPHRGRSLDCISRQLSSIGATII